MNLLTLTMVLAFADAPQLNVTTIEGPVYSGQLNSANAETWSLTAENGDQALPASRILEVRIESPPDPPEVEIPVSVVLSDSSILSSTTAAVQGDSLRITSPLLGEVTLPRSVVSELRLVASPSEVDADWDKLTEREREKDMLVIKKENRLDFVEGVIGDVNDAQVSFLLNGQTVPVPRDRVFGMLFRQTGDEQSPPAAEITTVHGDLLAVEQISSADGSSLNVTMSAGPKVSIPVTGLRIVDFSPAKLKWLSALQPRDVKHEFRFIDPAKPFENDRDVWGKPLRLGDRTFTRGVCIRSRTTLRYRLNGDFTRFQALMGIQSGYSGDVRVEISIDGQKVLDQKVKPGNQDPTPIDLELTDKFVLDILVDFGDVESDIGDHLVLANARLLR